MEEEWESLGSDEAGGIGMKFLAKYEPNKNKFHASEIIEARGIVHAHKLASEHENKLGLRLWSLREVIKK